MKIGLVYAMPKEAAGFLARRDNPPSTSIAGVPFFSLPDGTVLCLGGVGKVNTALAVQLLIDHYSVARVIHAGCVGALTDLPTGTLIVGSDCVQHDVDTTLCGDPPGFVSTVERVRFPCFQAETMQKKLCDLGFSCRLGTVATGDWFGRDFQRAAAIRDTFQALACDMEAGAAAQVCLRNQVPFQTLKSVSDHVFSPDQGSEYQTNFHTAMTTLHAATAAWLDFLQQSGKTTK